VGERGRREDSGELFFLGVRNTLCICPLGELQRERVQSVREAV